MARIWRKTPGGIEYTLEDKVVRVRTTPQLLQTMSEGGKASLALAEELRTLYEAEFGRPLEITAASLAAEIEIHARLDLFFRRSLKRINKLPGRPMADFVGKMRDHVDVIDCGERSVDNNRFAFDFLAFLYRTR